MLELTHAEVRVGSGRNIETDELRLEVVFHKIHASILEIIFGCGDCRLRGEPQFANDGEYGVKHDLPRTSNEAEEVVPTADAVDARFRLTVGHIWVFGHVFSLR